MPLWLRRAFAQREPQIVIPGKAGVPVYINGVDASWGVVVVGEFGLDRPGLVAPTVIYRPLIAEFPTNVPAYRGAGRLCGGRAGDVWRLRCATAAAVFAQPVAPAPNSAGYQGGSWGGAAGTALGQERLGRWLRLLWRLRRVLRPWFCRFTGPGERRRPALRRAFLF